MNDKINAILKKHFNMDLLTDYDAKDLNNAIIEICEEQMKNTVKEAKILSRTKVVYADDMDDLLNSKNIAE
jgi:hypothetical protein